MEHTALVVIGIFPFEQFAFVVLLDILCSLHNEAGTTHGRVANSVAERRAHEFDHHADDVARSAKLPVVATCRHLSKHILIDIAHGVAIVHIEVVDAFDDFGQCARALDEKSCVSHKTTICTLLPLSEILDENKHVAAYGVIHLIGFHIAKHIPTEVVVRHIFVGFGIVPHTGFESRVFDHRTPRVGVGFFGALSIIEHLHEEEIGHLLKDGDRVGDTSCPKGIPYRVDTIFDFACNHTKNSDF